MSEAPRKILILGGYGVFGGRLAQLLATDRRVTLILAGRSLDKARTFSDSLPAGAPRIALAFDRDGDVDAQLASIKPDVVVDASGPFQAYSGDIYKLVRAAIALGADYMDLADSSEFVAGIGAFDAAARAKGVYALGGVSSFPVLTAAVVRRLAEGLARVETIQAGIAPSPFARVGPNVIRAIASYAGQAVTLTRDGAKTQAYGLTETKRRAVRPPGMLSLESRLFSLVDVPDLRALPPLWPGLRSIWIGAAPVPEILHRALIALAWLARLRLLPNLAPLAPLFHAVLGKLRWGEHRGGMFVEIEGADDAGRAVRRSWHMLAEGDDGPLIPSMAIAAILRNELDGRRPAAGARAATGELELADYDAVFRPYAIRHAIRDDSALADAPLYRRMLAGAWDDLPAALRVMHTVVVGRVAQGEADIERGSGLLAGLVAALFGFPKAARGAPTSVRFEANDGVETWTRTFAGRIMRSSQWQGAGRWEGLLCESFGPFTFGLAALTGDGCLRLAVRRWALFGLPLPIALAPRGHAVETEQDGRFRFDVAIRAPLIGMIVRYQGWLAPE
ncbi:SDR family oxidoreductase [Methylocapsa sp. S129]|uniref:SDR family oxidoreductase n=1 Tax=Methylocapsa sp. S129 TaxID=1641869 RepID=UPI00131C481B|nr:SDR family oxidoreductase [Methylocapsa sp. S129]